MPETKGLTLEEIGKLFGDDVGTTGEILDIPLGGDVDEKGNSKDVQVAVNVV